MTWLADSWHKIVIVLIALDRLWARIEPYLDRFEGIERRIGERRNNTMNVPVITQLVNLIEEIFKHNAPQVAKAAEAAAAGAAIETVEADPKAQAATAAAVAMLTAAQQLKAALNQPDAPAAVPPSSSAGTPS